ncbi:hypothetical protein CROQUDRAFT_565183 [Cronartium quercuum f. sp. fusiforme G11]|uniref:Uncharacterized protein n=1 Tax=Cronartium quercuum f. sp. fusiforme G11 TaxID=708437 RepID=A0A9P6NGG7_9BASI|nr:hypothetical protein CROQUDRAFT_565183 [Cronartium quercuum f. sp. fusiforme G11]
MQVRGASVLPSGNIKLYVASRYIKAWLLYNKHLWSMLAIPDLVTTQTRFPVLIHSVPSDTDPTSGDFIASFAAENAIPEDEIAGVRWLVKPNREAAHGSIVMNFTSKQVANQVEKGRVFMENSVSHSDEYDKLPAQCFSCRELAMLPINAVMDQSARYAPKVTIHENSPRKTAHQDVSAALIMKRSNFF